MKSNCTKNYYERCANEYFAAKHEVDLQHVWRMFSRKLHNNALILDLGCGTGRDLKYFASQKFRAVGIDFSLNMLKLAQSSSEQPAVLADFSMPLPFYDDTFDGIWAIASLLHISRDRIPFVLSEMHRILKANAILFTSVKQESGEATENDGRYYTYYGIEEWKYVITKGGYNIETIHNVVENRKVCSGYKPITWIECLAYRV